MPWCPGCSFEYVQGRRKCPECGASLSSSRNSDNIRYRNRVWASIREAHDPAQAEIIKNFLKANGFDVVVKNGRNSKSRQKGTQPAQILVPLESASFAASLLRADSQYSEDELTDPDELIDEEEELVDEDEFDPLLDDPIRGSDELIGSYDEDEDYY